MKKFALAFLCCALVGFPAAAHVVQLDSMNQLGALEFNTPISQRFVTKGGIPVRFTPLHGLPIIDVSVNFGVGSGYDGDQHGLANLTADALTKGTKTLDENTLLAKLDDLGVVVSASASKDTVSLSLRSLSDQDTRQAAIALIYDMLKNPAFDPLVLEKSKQQTITHLNQNSEDPAFVAKVALDKALYGDHPYAHQPAGEPSSIQKITAQDLKRFYDEFLVKQNATITITGDLDDKDARTLAKILDHALKDGKKASALPAPKAPTYRHQHITHPSGQVVVMGNLTDPFSNQPKDIQRFANFAMANDVLAGADFNSRLMNEIRVNNGYTYGIYGRATRLKDAGSYVVNFSTKADVASDAIQKTKATIAKTLTDGISQDELNLAVFNNKNSYPTHFSSNAGLHGIMQAMSVYDLPDDYLQDYPKRLDRVDLKSANQALADTIDMEHAIIITVGQEAPHIAP